MLLPSINFFLFDFNFAQSIVCFIIFSFSFATILFFATFERINFAFLHILEKNYLFFIYILRKKII